MSELNVVLEALRKADAAGNVEDARKLASIAEGLSKGPSQQGQNEKIQGSDAVPYIDHLGTLY